MYAYNTNPFYSYRIKKITNVRIFLTALCALLAVVCAIITFFTGHKIIALVLIILFLKLQKKAERDNALLKIIESKKNDDTVIVEL
jgi:glucan phosphoethanolaminetransferase (alkaline phosphatase superfamily)